MCDDDAGTSEENALRIPVNGVLDLHTFHPRDIADVVVEYIKECIASGTIEVRIIHGKGVGYQKKVVRDVLSRMPEVLSFKDAEVTGGGWGATTVRLAAHRKTPAR